MHHRSHDQHPGPGGGGGICLRRSLHEGEGLPTGGLHPEGLCRPPPAGTRKVGGMHPTGMLSCLYFKVNCQNIWRSLQIAINYSSLNDIANRT